MRLFKKLNSLPLRLKVWLYFAAFTSFVFVLLWVFEIIFLEHFYEGMKINDVDRVAKTLVNSYGKSDTIEYSTLLSKSAADYDMCIEIFDKYGRSLYSRDVTSDCMIHGRENRTYEYLQLITQSNEGEIYMKLVNPRNGYNMLLYGSYIGSPDDPKGFLLLNSALVPVGSTAGILKQQLKIITMILIVIAFFISIFLSNSIAKPIAKITKDAKNLAKGDFSTEFSGEGYLESMQLASALNYAEMELSKVDTMQRDLISNISHDLRTPLTMLKAYAEMIRDLSGDNPIKRGEHLEIIINETDRLTLLVNDILDLSKLESGKQKLSCSEFNIRTKMEDIITRYKGLSDKMEYHIHFTPDKDRMVYCDIVKIEQVIYNLINNAINYTGDDKQIYIRQINKPDGVLIEVEDTGDGIEQDKINLIFDKYYRSENHKREVVGTGIGLSIVKAVLKIHGFDYGVNSTIGKGSVFWFKISDHLKANISTRKS